jgi:hypothetical protein
MVYVHSETQQCIFTLMAVMAELVASKVKSTLLFLTVYVYTLLYCCNASCTL